MNPPILEISSFFADAAEPASFPQTVLRYSNTRWAEKLGLELNDATAWTRHFGRFESLPGNLETPLALRYHGHQFHVYNPDLGDGRGFLFAQLKDPSGRWLGQVEMPLGLDVRAIQHRSVIGVQRDDLDVESIRFFPIRIPGDSP